MAERTGELLNHMNKACEIERRGLANQVLEEAIAKFDAKYGSRGSDQ